MLGRFLFPLLALALHAAAAAAGDAVLATTDPRFVALVDLVRSAEGGYVSESIAVVDSGDERGNIVVARQPIAIGETIAVFPKSIFLTHATLPSLTPQLREKTQSFWDRQDVLSPRRLFPIKILHEALRARKGESPWKAWFDVLPDTFATPPFMSDVEQGALVGTTLEGAGDFMNRFYNDFFQPVRDHVLRHNEDVFPPDKFTPEAYRWAASVMSSRSFHSPLSNENMVPLLDMFNSDWDRCSSYYFEEDKNAFVLKAWMVDYAIGDEIFINYRSASNADLLNVYGYVVPNNPFDYLTLEFESKLGEEADADEEKRSRLLTTRGYGRMPILYLDMYRSDPLPLRALSVARIVALNASELAAYDEHEDVFMLPILEYEHEENDGHESVEELTLARTNHLLDMALEPPYENSLRALKMLMTSILNRIAKYDTTIEQDLVLRKQSYLTRGMQSAIEVRLTEKRILSVALNIIAQGRAEVLDAMERQARAERMFRATKDDL